MDAVLLIFRQFEAAAATTTASLTHYTHTNTFLHNMFAVDAILVTRI